MILGTAVKITSVISITPSDVTVSIWDNTKTLKIDEASMSDDGDNSYSYIYQSAVGDVQGNYTVIITATDGAYTVKSKKIFVLDKYL